MALGRCWHAGNAADAIGQVLVRDSSLGAHGRRLAGHQRLLVEDLPVHRVRQLGAGKTQGTSDRPQMSATTAAGYTSVRYLAGSDGWNPVQP